MDINWTNVGLLGGVPLKMVAFRRDGKMYSIDHAGHPQEWVAQTGQWLQVKGPWSFVSMTFLEGALADKTSTLVTTNTSGEVGFFDMASSTWAKQPAPGNWTITTLAQDRLEVFVLGTGGNLGIAVLTSLTPSGLPASGFQLVQGPTPGNPGGWTLDWVAPEPWSERLWCVGTPPEGSPHSLGVYDLTSDSMQLITQDGELRMIAWDPDGNLWGVNCDGSVVQCSPPSLTESDRETALRTYAPRVYFAEGEQYLPSSVDWAFPNFIRHRPDDDRYWITTREELKRSIDILDFFHGDVSSACVYAFWVDKLYGCADLVYFFYFPYNWGKIVGARLRWGAHVSDWEHVTVRVRWTVVPGQGWQLVPSWMYYAAHDTGTSLNWSEVPIASGSLTHPVAYCASGSHGFWPTLGEHTYKFFGWEWLHVYELTDECSQGHGFNSWNSLVAFDFTRKTGLGGSSWPTWMSVDYTNPGPTNPSKGQNPANPDNGAIYRWGNQSMPDCVPGVCQLEDGPTGPVDKGVWSPDNFE